LQFTTGLVISLLKTKLLAWGPMGSLIFPHPIRRIGIGQGSVIVVKSNKKKFPYFHSAGGGDKACL
jgi:hypothetical protein